MALPIELAGQAIKDRLADALERGMLQPGSRASAEALVALAYVCAADALEAARAPMRREAAQEVADWVRADRRPREQRCRMCGSTTARNICGEADRLAFGCLMEPAPVESWADAIAREFGEATQGPGTVE